MELIRGYIVFLICTSSFIVDHNDLFIKYGQKILGKKLFTILMKMTFYGHFVAGENRDKILPKVTLMGKYHVRSILDYAVEEELSHFEAEKRGMEDITPEIKTSEEEDESKKEIGGELPQFKQIEEFADRRKDVDSARVYFYENEAACDRVADIVVESIRTAAADKGSGFVALKLTALCRPQLLLELSEVIKRSREFVKHITGREGSILHQKLTVAALKEKLDKLGIKDVDCIMKNVEHDNEVVIHLFPWDGIINENFELNDTFKVPSLKHGKMIRLIAQLSVNEEEMFRNMLKRMNRIACAANEHCVHVMIDAEHTYFQPAISRIAVELMNVYNKKRATIFNTYQMYLVESFDELQTDIEIAKRQNFYFGCKLVRGAYMHHERERAERLNYPDPINPTYEATSCMFYQGLDYIFQQIKIFKNQNLSHRLLAMIASHNEDTVRYVVQEMGKYCITTEDEAIYFGQLYGMCDFMTFPLGEAGYMSYKYVPYGPVEEVIPYLSRRAKENKSVLKKLSKEKSMLLKELKRRIIKADIFHRP